MKQESAKIIHMIPLPEGIWMHPAQEDEDSYNEAAAYFFHGLAMEQGNGLPFLAGHLNEINSFS